MKITSNFDSGNITVISADSAESIQLAIKKDHNSEFYQWFHYRLESTAGIQHTMVLTNAKQSAYVDGWKDYQAVASYDRETWFRVHSDFDGEELTITHTPEQDVCFYAYFAPYGYERHLDLIHWAQTMENCRLTTIGETLDGRDMSVLTIGEPAEGKPSIWITARQHPGESMAEWFVEGMLERLFNPEDAIAKKLLQSAVLYVVPNMNPDGSVRGHLRTNANGANLNREWLTPTMDNSPEVFLVKEMMKKTGVDMYLDIHGDEALPYNFVAGSEGVPNYDDRIASLEQTFKQALLQATPDFQDVHGYPKDKPGDANLTVASNNVCHEFNCLAYTVEMPFKDNADLPDEVHGWSDSRSKLFGQDMLVAVLAVVNHLR